MRKVIRRAAVAASVIVAAGTVQLVTAASASATPAQCTSYLQTYGYKVGPQVTLACLNAGYIWDGGGGAPDTCYAELIDLGVKSEHASFACFAK